MPCKYCNSNEHIHFTCGKLATKVHNLNRTIKGIVYDYEKNLETEMVKIISPLDKFVLSQYVCQNGGYGCKTRKQKEDFCYTQFRKMRDDFYNNEYVDAFRIQVMHDPRILAQEKKFYKKNECAICLGQTSDICYVKTNCGHSFCNCILHHIMVNGVKCPLCRQNIYSLSYTNAQFYVNKKVKKIVETCEHIYFTNLKQV